MDEGISFSLADAIVKTTERSRGRMKIQIKLSKEQAEGFTNFKSLVKPPDMSDESFTIQVFFAGCNALANELRAHAQAEMEKKEKEEGSKSKDKKTPKLSTPETPAEKTDEQ
tara:strand:- start:1845 stop:2180 length:336 start_codon:yes stop_codon:yes gene_type:complete